MPNGNSCSNTNKPVSDWRRGTCAEFAGDCFIVCPPISLPNGQRSSAVPPKPFIIKKPMEKKQIQWNRAERKNGLSVKVFMNNTRLAVYELELISDSFWFFINTSDDISGRFQIEKNIESASNVPRIPLKHTQALHVNGQSDHVVPADILAKQLEVANSCSGKCKFTAEEPSIRQSRANSSHPLMSEQCVHGWQEALPSHRRDLIQASQVDWF